MVAKKLKYPDTFFIELIIWIIALILAQTSLGLSILVAFAFSIYRQFNKKKVCPKCGTESIVPSSTPAVKK